MCFSATASFVTAGLTGAVGMVAMSRANEPRDYLLAGMPILFAFQQSVEGLLWLNLMAEPDGSNSSALTTLFLLFAEVLWPIYVPAAVFCVEPNFWRRRAMGACVTIGVGVAAWLLWCIVTRSHGAVILNDHVVYVTERRQSDFVAGIYFAAICLTPLLCSRRLIAALGVIILVGSAVAYVLYWDAFTSVWCFFAALSSGMILFHFDQARRARVRMATV
jgi:hypothetical protein